MNMRARTTLLIIAIALVAAFAALNIDEFSRPSVLSLGFTTIQVPLGLVMLVLLGVAVLAFLATTLFMQSANLLETRRYARELATQRELADRAEASRFTELRNFLDAQASATLNREAANATVMAERLSQTQAVILHRLDQSDNTTSAYMGQLEDRLERRGSVNEIRMAGDAPRS
jgi:uncharacterized integral membrane protein